MKQLQPVTRTQVEKQSPPTRGFAPAPQALPSPPKGKHHPDFRLHRFGLGVEIAPGPLGVLRPGLLLDGLLVWLGLHTLPDCFPSHLPVLLGGSWEMGGAAPKRTQGTGLGAA